MKYSKINDYQTYVYNGDDLVAIISREDKFYGGKSYDTRMIESDLFKRFDKMADAKKFISESIKG